MPVNSSLKLSGHVSVEEFPLSVQNLGQMPLKKKAVGVSYCIVQTLTAPFGYSSHGKFGSLSTGRACSYSTESVALLSVPIKSKLCECVLD